MARVRDGIHLVTLGGKQPYEVFHEHARTAFKATLERIDDEIIETFERIQITAHGVDWEGEGLFGPSSTWTYLISDQQFGSWVGLLSGSNIGFTAGAAGFIGPLYILLGLLRKRRWRKNSPTDL